MIYPLRFRALSDGDVLFAGDGGDFFLADPSFLERYASDSLTQADIAFLRENGHACQSDGDFQYLTYLRRIAARAASLRPFNYVILVPTLRCNLACTYCQVSRAPENAVGFDWDEGTLAAVLQYLDGLQTDEIKVEFQGGEPLIRLDLLEQVYQFCEERFEAATYVVCTNLQRLGPQERAFLRLPNVAISTSLDGDALTHQRNRTRDPALTNSFFTNLREALAEFGPDKVSALPTIDYGNPPDIDLLIDSYESFGFRSIYLRPINHQGFARKAHAHLKDDISRWNEYYFAFLDRLIERNYRRPPPLLDEYYFTLCLNRALKSGHDHHVDLRNPNPLGEDYVVIDHDGSLYPTDEARMVTRTGQIDLSIGDVRTGVDKGKLDQLNVFAFNNFHEDCIHCPYQPFCGTDTVDDLSRYGRVDMPKHETWFCKRHMSLFDRAFQFLYSQQPTVRYSVHRWLGLPGDGTELGVRFR